MKVSQRRKLLPGNLPTPLSVFVGREREINGIKLSLSENRIVTLTGTGGSGKTRLALKVAHELQGDFADGVWFVELASLSDPQLIPQTVASALSVREISSQPVLNMLFDYLVTRETLLVIDNCEHLIAACARFIETLLQKCPTLRILTTNREVLGITGEVASIVPPLSLPAQQPWRNPVSAQGALSSVSSARVLYLQKCHSTL